MFDRKEHMIRISKIKHKWICDVCGVVFMRTGAFGSHIRVHNLSVKQYYDLFINPGATKICECKKDLKFISISVGYNKFCSSNCIKSKIGTANPNYGKMHEDMHSQEFKDKISKRTIERIKNGELIVGVTKGKKLNLSDEQRQRLRVRIVKVNKKGFINKGGRCKWFNVDNILVQGSYELYYYLNNKHLVKIKQRIKTPYGWYTPDFLNKLNDEYVEIKSTYTIKTCVKRGQMKKIKWVSENMKKVKVIVLKERDVQKYLANIDLKQFTPTLNHL